ATRREGDRDRRHRHVVRRLHDDRYVVLSVRVAANENLHADRIGDLLADQFETVLGILDLGCQRLRRVGDLVQVLWHGVLLLVSWTSRRRPSRRGIHRSGGGATRRESAEIPTASSQRWDRLRGRTCRRHSIAVSGGKHEQDELVS